MSVKAYPDPEARMRWDGSQALDFVHDDGGREAAGWKGKRARDCVTRAIAIASGRPYDEVYEALAKGNAAQRIPRKGHKKRSAGDGIIVQRKWFKDYMFGLGFKWRPLMRVGQGCQTHFNADEVPKTGRYVISLSKHYTAVIDGVIHDTFDPTRVTIHTENGKQRLVDRCVYGWWKLDDEELHRRAEMAYTGKLLDGAAHEADVQDILQRGT